MDSFLCRAINYKLQKDRVYSLYIIQKVPEPIIIIAAMYGKRRISEKKKIKKKKKKSKNRALYIYTVV